jgi:hypothetical protein
MEYGRGIDNDGNRAKQPDKGPDLRRNGVRHHGEREPYTVCQCADQQTRDLHILAVIEHGPAVEVEDERHIDMRSVPSEQILDGCVSLLSPRISLSPLTMPMPKARRHGKPIAP